MAWKIETVDKKSIVDVEYFTKNLPDGESLTFAREVGYRRGYIIVNEDPTDAIAEAKANNQPLHVNMLSELDHSYDDGCWSEDKIDDLPEEEQELLGETYSPEDAGWDCVDSDTYFHGELSVTRVRSRYPYDEIDDDEEDE